MSAKASDSSQRPVRVIVPVYKNLAVTRRCLESLKAAPLPPHCAVTVIVDGSPEPELVRYCEEAASAAGFELVVNATNQGFVRTANQGFAIDDQADVVLLNSDTQVSGNWLERMQRCAYRHPDIGTVTPFSNNGTICSYPLFPFENPLPEGWDTAALDTLFNRANTDEWHPIPTAVGFCMYIRRDCLVDTGEFDAENFGQGYGEECDFSLRASAKGWQHALCADVFVFHEGGASFSDETEARKQHADSVMATLHPAYDELITVFIEDDPVRHLRDRVTQARLTERPGDITHVLAEQAALDKRLRTRIAKEQESTARVRDEMQRVQTEREKLEALLASSRADYATTQTALDKAHEALDTHAANFTRLQAEAGELLAQVHVLSDRLEELENELRASHQSNRELSARLEEVLASRSWRYTRWLRKEG